MTSDRTRHSGPICDGCEVPEGQDHAPGCRYGPGPFDKPEVAESKTWPSRVDLAHHLDRFLEGATGFAYAERQMIRTCADRLRADHAAATADPQILFPERKIWRTCNPLLEAGQVVLALQAVGRIRIHLDDGTEQVQLPPEDAQAAADVVEFALREYLSSVL